MKKMKRFLVYILVFFSLFGPSFTSIKGSNQIKENGLINSKSTEQVWPFERNTAQRPGSTIHNASQNEGGEKWKFFTDSHLSTSAVIDSEGVVYASTYAGNLYAIYPNGTQKWSFKTNHDYSEAAPGIAPDGTIYFCTMKHLYSISSDGAELWVFNDSGHFSCEPIIDSNGTIYASAFNQDTGWGAIYAIDSIGTKKWEYPLSYPNFVTSLALDHENNLYFVLSGWLYCIKSNGDLKWMKNFNLEDNVVISPDETLYIWNSSHIVALTPEGLVKWSIENFHYHGFISLAPDGTLILSGASNFISALSQVNGSILWQYKIDENPFVDDVTPAAISGDGIVFFAYSAFSHSVSYICALTKEGRLEWETLLRSKILPYDREDVYSSPSIAADGTVYITSRFIRGGTNNTDFGYIHAIGIKNSIAPEKPIIKGPQVILILIKTKYTLCSNISKGENISYFVFWDDFPNGTENAVNWVGPFPPNEPIRFNHHFLIPGKHFIKARAIGDDSLCSLWTILEVRTLSNLIIQFILHK